MSFTKLRRKMQRDVAMTTMVLARIEQEGAQLLRDAAAKGPAKIIARETGISSRQVYNLREGDTGTRWKHFIALALRDDELRRAIGRWLGYEGTQDSAGAELLEAARKILQAHGE